VKIKIGDYVKITTKGDLIFHAKVTRDGESFWEVPAFRTEPVDVNFIGECVIPRTTESIPTKFNIKSIEILTNEEIVQLLREI
jgi:hypothetical protein